MTFQYGWSVIFIRKDIDVFLIRAIMTNTVIIFLCMGK